MSNLYSSESPNSQDETSFGNEEIRQSIEVKPLIEDSIASDLFCRKPGCEHLQFSSELQHRNHILTHITLPSVIVPRLDSETVKKSIQQQVERQDSLKLRLKLTSNSGSDKRAFEDILANEHIRNSLERVEQLSEFSLYDFFQSGSYCAEVVKEDQRVSTGPRSLSYLNGFDNEVIPELSNDRSALLSIRSSSGGPGVTSELDVYPVSESLGSSGDQAQNSKQVEQDQYQHNPNNYIEEDKQEAGNNKDDREIGLISTGNQIPSNSPLSPAPSEFLRVRGYLASELSVDDDSCYPRSPPASPTRMVEMNGSTSVVSVSDNDSGHSRSPIPFTGGSGSGSGGEEDSSAQQVFNWDDLVAETSGHNSSDGATNENGQTDGSPAGGVNNVSSDLDSNNVAASILANDPLLLPENAASAEGEQDNLSLLQNLTADPLQGDVDRGAGGDTEYMSLDRLGEATFCCEVCGERTQDRHALEEHRAMARHYKCVVQPECGSIVWATATELTDHQSSIHGLQPRQPSPQAQPQVTTPQTSPHAPHVQQLAQQVQRIPVPVSGAQSTGQPGYPGQYPAVPSGGPQQQIPPQMGQMMPQMMPGQMSQQRRSPAGYRGHLTGPYGPGSPTQQPPGYAGSIQPRPLNTMVAQQGGRAPLPPGRMPAGGPAMGGRGMGHMSMRGQKRHGPQSGRGAGHSQAKQRRVEGMMPPQQDNGSGKKSDASAVANILATRGITVTPAGGGGPGGPGVGRGAQPSASGRQRQGMVPPAPPAPVTTLNLNSAISIIPTTGSGNGRQQNNSGFAVPQVRAPGRQPMTTASVERPPRPPTVDLTGDGPTPPPGSTRLQMGPTFHRGRGRPSNLSRLMCQICDKAFASPEVLQQHMAMHRGPGKLPFRCNLCNAQYPTQQGLQQHRLTYHKEAVGMSTPLAPSEEMVIPLIDLKQPGVAARLSSLGIHHCIPLSGLGNQSNGYFSLPVVSIDGSRPGAAGNLRSLGANGVLSIGPIKLVPK